MDLYLVQHAEAKSKEEAPDRPLTENGAGDIKAVSAFLGGHGDLTVNSILHSGKTRARQTADILAEHLLPSGDAEQAEGLDPLADPKIWIRLLESGHENLMLVGHMPHLGRLAAHLLTGVEGREPVKFRNGAVVRLTRDESGNWSLRWMVTPELVRERSG